MQRIADKFGLTRERVRQILKGAGVRTTVTGFGDRIEVSCTNCGKLQKRFSKEVIWAINNLQQETFFCDNACKGKWFINYPPNKPKYNHNQILEAYKTNTAEEVTKEFGCSIATINRIAQANNFHKYARVSAIKGENANEKVE
jgi:predicted transcriptional regulator